MLKLRSQNKLNPGNIDDYIKSISCFEDKAIFTNPDELPQKIVAMSDIHGDLEALFSILLNAEVINIKGEWKANNTFLVITGDIFDKGRNSRILPRVGVRPDRCDGYNGPDMYIPYDIIDKVGNVKTLSNQSLFDLIYTNEPFGEEGDEIIILKFLADLNNQAQSGNFGNSRVLLCFGNHEVLNVMDYIDTNYVSAIKHGYIHPMDTLLFGGPTYPKRKELFTVGTGLLSQKLACIFKLIVVVGDFIFCHGGLNSNALRDINSIDQLDGINHMFKQYLLGAPDIDITLLNRYVGNNTESIVWYRAQGDKYIIDKICDETIQMFTNKFGNPNFNLVIGHSPQGECIDKPSKINDALPKPRLCWDRKNSNGTVDTCITMPNSVCNNQIYRIDTLISRMNSTSDYRYPAEGRLNSLIIDLNPNGSKRSVIARNNVVRDIQLYPPQP